MVTTKAEQVLELACREGMLRAKDAVERGFHHECLRRLCEKGLLVRVARGLYVPADKDFGAHQTLAEVAKRVPRGVVCLLSALRFHEIGTQLPHEVWVAIDRKAALPQVGRLPMHIVRFSGPALTEGIEERNIGGVRVKVYCPAKTVADCFKYRNKIGLDVALEAMRNCRQQRKATMDELWRYAKICRVANVMQPYLEATT
jgi:predicted transcriptional regulator of viral defense system